MHRVASRQRLFSWDHFDARSPSSEVSVSSTRAATEIATATSTSTTAAILITNDKENQSQTMPSPAAVISSSTSTVGSFTFIERSKSSSNNNTEDDEDDYKTCISNMSRHNSMIFFKNSSSFAFDNETNIDQEYTIKDEGHVDNDHVDVRDKEVVVVAEEEEEYNVVSDDEDDNDNDYCTATTAKSTTLDNKNGMQELEVESVTASSATKVSSLSSLFMMNMLLAPSSKSSSTLPLTSPSIPSSTLPLTSSLLFQMNQDVQFTILSFLDLNDLRSITLSCKYFLALLHDDDDDDDLNTCNDVNTTTTTTTKKSSSIVMQKQQHACAARNAIWWNVMKEMWPFLALCDTSNGDGATRSTSTSNSNIANNHNNNNNATTTTVMTQQGKTTKKGLYPDMVKFVIQQQQQQQDATLSSELTSIPTNTATTTTATKIKTTATPNNINYGLLLTQAIKSPPTCIDSTYFDPTTTFNTSVVRFNHNILIRRHRMSAEKQMVFTKYDMEFIVGHDDDNDVHDDNHCHHEKEKKMIMEVVQYVGSVGIGDRSITSNYPFPRPLDCIPCFKREKRDLQQQQLQHEVQQQITASSSLSSRGRKRSLSTSATTTTMTKPTGYMSRLTHHNDTHTMMSHRSMNLLDRLRSCNSHGSSVGAIIHNFGIHSTISDGNAVSSSAVSSSGKKYHGNLPFVSPMVVNSTLPSFSTLSDCTTTATCPEMKRYVEIDLTPKLMAYYEVTILSRDERQEPMLHVEDNTRSHRHYHVQPQEHNTINDNDDNYDDDDNNEIVQPRTSACVAIGLSSSEYSSSKRLPGWDAYSYGYHGDDGGIFHSNGNMIRVYGPKYGVNDCIGCGVNYTNGGIFFTLNGDFLGYAWCNEKVVLNGKVDLFPTIGVDTNNPLACNFGNERPFLFDFAKFVATQGDTAGGK